MDSPTNRSPVRLICAALAAASVVCAACGGVTQRSANTDGGAADSTTEDALATDDANAHREASLDEGASPDGSLVSEEASIDAGADATTARAVDSGLASGSDGGAMKSGVEGGPLDAGNDGDSPACSAYCATIMTACRGGNAQYKDMASCLAGCRFLVTGPTWTHLPCRATNAGYAMVTPNPYCWYAGPLGYQGCGPAGEGFCDIAAKLCSPSGGFDAGPAPYNSVDDCVLHSGYAIVGWVTPNIPGGVGLDGGFGVTGPASGDTLDCRAYHMINALQGGAVQQQECQNVGPTSPVCR